MTSNFPRRLQPRASASDDAADARLRTLLTRQIAETGREPSLAELAELSGLGVGGLRKALRRLEARHGLLLHPRGDKAWVVHPFSLYPASCWVQGRDKGWWATCLYCAFGVCGCVGEDVVITARFGGEAEAAEYRVQDGRLAPTSDLFHFLTPPRRWWDNVIYACATFQPFRSESDIDAWCARHGAARGYVIPVERLFDFALDWYRPHAGDWRARSVEDKRACFGRHGLTGPFWEI